MKKEKRKKIPTYSFKHLFLLFWLVFQVVGGVGCWLF